MLGRNGGLMNDRRGHTAAAHLFHRFPDFAPKRLLELGCGIGASLVPLAGYFPGAEAHGIDVGAAQLRSEEHTSELQSLMRISYAVFCLKKKIYYITKQTVLI